MKKVDKNDILSVEQWERVRPVLRPLFIHEKERRRLTVGSHLTFLFENTATVWYQIEEMIRSERLTDAGAIQHEIDTYNELIPARGEISATLLIEFSEVKEREAALRRLIGIEKHLWLRLGDARVPLLFDERQMSPERVSSVQFVRFNVAKDTAAFLALAQSDQVSIVADHPNLGAQAFINNDLARSLGEDLGD
ncbi:MAG TPA: DUF3501 family protein [Candidatus Binataceae bacterium]|nr:DUF3501 family protein [Candidatus Binataceae bacterium]